MAERACAYFTEEFGLQTRIVRFHNIFGPRGTFDGGREKAPAALCRKVAMAADGGSIELWGDGEQTRSFCYIDDCIEGMHRLMASDYSSPLNLGTDRLVSINELAGMIIRISGKRLTVVHVDGPQGVRGRNSDNTQLSRVLGWEPGTSLDDGLEQTYAWIAEQVATMVRTLAAAS
jgi:nucleoside-diphosphate-sugar epimerase